MPEGPTTLEALYGRALLAFNRRDLDVWLSVVDEDVEIESRFSSFGQHRFRGHRAVERWWNDLDEAWDSIELEFETVREVAPDETLALARLKARGRGSGVEISEPVAHRFEWRDGLCIRVSYVDREEAERELAATPPSEVRAAPSSPGRS